MSINTESFRIQTAQSAGVRPTSPISSVSAPPSPVHIRYVPVEPLSFLRLESRLDGEGEYLLRVTQVEEPMNRGEEYKDYSFLAIKKYTRRHRNRDVTIRIQNEALKQAVEDAIGELHGISWKLTPLEIPTTPVLCSFFPELRAHLLTLDPDGEPAKHLQLLIRYLETDHNEILDAIKALNTHGLVDYETLPFVYMPKSLLIFKCSLSSLPRATRLLAIREVYSNASTMWELECDYTELSHNKNGHESGKPGISEVKCYIPFFEGSVDVATLTIYPLKFHPNVDVFYERIGRKRKAMGAIHWDASSTLRRNWLCLGSGPDDQADKYWNSQDSYAGMSRAAATPNVKDFIIDQDDLSVDSQFALKFVDAQNKEEITAEQFIIATPLLYGYSFHDHAWVVMPIDALSEIQWQKDAFNRLEIPERQKDLLKAVVAAHVEPTSRLSLDDFIQRKGKGLVISLHGPSGVGKTLTAEGLSQLFRKPLYVCQREISYWSGATMETVLKEVFLLATLWDAMVLFDEADSYLQQREPEAYQPCGSLLQQLEYFPGIVFFTTNHVRVIDKAFKSRIHLSLHYPALSAPVRRKIWSTFLERAGANTKALTEVQWRYLASLDLNGREIKNTIRTSQDYMVDKKREISFVDVLYVMSIVKSSSQQRLAVMWNEQVSFWTSNTSQALPVCLLILSVHLAALTLFVATGFIR